MTNIKKLLQILIPGIILAIIVYALFLFFGGTILYLLGLKYNNLLSSKVLWDIFNFEYDSRLYSCMFFKGFERAKRTYRYPI